MDINKCPNCQKQYDQDKRLSKQLPCGCFSCLKCYKTVFKLVKEIKCQIHEQVYKINPEKLQDYVVQEQVQLQVLPQPQERSIDQEQIAKQFRCLQDQYVSKKNKNREIMKEIQLCVQFFQHIQSLGIKEIMKSLLDQFSINIERIKNLLKRLSELQAINEAQQQKQNVILGQQDSRLIQKYQSQLQQQFQQILREIEELKKDQWMEVQSLKVNVQQCMFGMFAYLSENASGQLLVDREAELLIQNYFNQIKLQNSRNQVSSSEVKQKSYLQSSIIDQQLIQESQNIEQQQLNQVSDKYQSQDIVQVNQLYQEQAMIIDPVPSEIITFENLIQFLNQIKNERMSVQQLHHSLLNNSRLTEYSQILYQLPQVTDQQICLQLIQMLNLSKNQPQIKQTAANAITILNFMNFSFTNQDLSDLDLSASDLSDTTFTSCNFSNSNLTQANLRNSKFLNCDLSNANLNSIITEYPHIFTGHTDSVTSVAISSDSNIIVSGSLDNTIILWDVKTGKSKTMSGHTDRVTSISISSDSEFIVSGSVDETIILWDVKTGKSKTMSGHKNSVLSVAISRDSEFIVSGS